MRTELGWERCIVPINFLLDIICIGLSVVIFVQLIQFKSAQ